MSSEAKFLRVEESAQLVAPSGNGAIAVPIKVFEAVKEFTEGRKTGSITLQFKDGNLVGTLGSFSYR